MLIGLVLPIRKIDLLQWKKFKSWCQLGSIQQNFGKRKKDKIINEK
jgi:hypothetical protein